MTTTLLVLSQDPGPCAECRHANQETADFWEGRLFCEVAQEPKSRAQVCDIERDLLVVSDTAVDLPIDEMETGKYFLFEVYDGSNGTYGRLQDRRLIGEDRPAEEIERQRQSLDGPPRSRDT